MTPTTLLRPRLILRLLLLAAAALGIAGCLEVEAHIDRQGAGTLKMKFSHLDAKGDLRTRKQLESPAVKLVQAAYADGVGTYEIAFSDVTKLRTAPWFRHLRIQHGDLQSSRRKISVSIPRRERGDGEKHLPEDNYVVIDLQLTLPGTIVETNGAKKSDTTANWQIRLEDLLGKGSVDIRTVYDLAAAPPDEAGSSTTPAAAAGGSSNP